MKKKMQQKAVRKTVSTTFYCFVLPELNVHKTFYTPELILNGLIIFPCLHQGIKVNNVHFVRALCSTALSCQANDTNYFYKSMIASFSKKSSTPIYKIPSLSCLGIMCFLTITIFLNESSIFLSDAVSCSLFSLLSTFKTD